MHQALSACRIGSSYALHLSAMVGLWLPGPSPLVAGCVMPCTAYASHQPQHPTLAAWPTMQDPVLSTATCAVHCLHPARRHTMLQDTHWPLHIHTDIITHACWYKAVTELPGQVLLLLLAAHRTAKQPAPATSIAAHGMAQQPTTARSTAAHPHCKAALQPASPPEPMLAVAPGPSRPHFLHRRGRIAPPAA